MPPFTWREARAGRSDRLVGAVAPTVVGVALVTGRPGVAAAAGETR